METEIKSVPAVVIIGLCLCFALVASEKLDLACDEYVPDPDVPDETFLYDGIYCTVSEMHVGYGDQVNCDVYPYYRDRIQVVKFTDSKMPFIPHGIFRYLTSIREFDISYTGIEAIHRDFEGARNLMFLTMTNNQLNELSASLFTDAPNISVIDFSHNKIERINPFTFVDVVFLSRLHFSYNRLIKLDPQVFEKLYALDYIALDHNELEHIEPELFARNSLLRKILLNDNRIVSLDCQVFAHTDYLNSLDLSHNQLLEFSTSCIGGQLASQLTLVINDNRLNHLTLKNVDSLDASNNNISTLSIEDDLCRTEKLIVANNSLANITSMFDRLGSLEHLDISFNHIGRLNISTFAALKNLKRLYLRHTQLQHINYGTFANQKELKVLDISYNDLNHIDFDVFFPYLKGLEELHIDGNNLTETGGLSWTAMHLFPNLKSLGLSNNRFNCSYLAKLFTWVDLEKVKFTVDSIETIANVTHVNGIACTIGNAQKIDVSSKVSVRNISDHYDSDHESEDRLLSYQHKHIDSLNEQLKLLQQRNVFLSDQESALESHIRSIKYLIATICAVSLVFVAFKLMLIYKQHKDIGGFAEGGIYHSTATMNTQQTNIAYE